MDAGGCFETLCRHPAVCLTVRTRVSTSLSFTSEPSGPVVSYSIPAGSSRASATFATEDRIHLRIVHLAIWIVMSKNPDASFPRIKGIEAIIC